MLGAPIASRIDELEKLAALYEKGLVSSEEFEETKAKLLARVGQEGTQPKRRHAVRRPPGPRPKPRPRPLPLGLGVPLLVVVPVALCSAFYPEVRFESETETLGLVLLSTEDRFLQVIEAVGIAGWLGIGLTALIAGLLPKRRQWMAAIPLGLLLCMRLLQHLLDSKYRLWWLEDFLNGDVSSERALLELPSYLLAFPEIVGVIGLVTLAGIRLRRPLGDIGKAALVLSILCAISSPYLVHWLLYAAISEDFVFASWWWRPAVLGVSLLLHLLAAILLLPRQQGRTGAGVYLGLTLFWTLAFWAIVSVKDEHLAAWMGAVWGGADLLNLIAALCMGLALGQPDSFPKADTEADVEIDAGTKEDAMNSDVEPTWAAPI